MTPDEQRAALNKLIDELANDVRPEVEKIEQRLATTKDHYGDYMRLLSLTAKDKQSAQLLAMACIRAGANRHGVGWAYKLTYGQT